MKENGFTSLFPDKPKIKRLFVHVNPNRPATQHETQADEDSRKSYVSSKDNNFSSFIEKNGSGLKMRELSLTR